LADRSTVISFNEFKSEVYQTPTGIPQRSPLSTALNWKQHIQNSKIKISKSIGALASLAGSTWGARVTELRKIYQAVVVPQMMYGCSMVCRV
jgi:hypothetical protein